MSPHFPSSHTTPCFYLPHHHPSPPLLSLCPYLPPSLLSLSPSDFISPFLSSPLPFTSPFSPHYPFPPLSPLRFTLHSESVSFPFSLFLRHYSYLPFRVPLLLLPHPITLYPPPPSQTPFIPLLPRSPLLLFFPPSLSTSPPLPRRPVPSEQVIKWMMPSLRLNHGHRLITTHFRRDTT